MSTLLNVDSALSNILASIKRLPDEIVSLADALDRVIASDIVSPIDLPPFDNSAMDGYAVHVEDSAGVKQNEAVSLQSPWTFSLAMRPRSSSLGVAPRVS